MTFQEIGAVNLAAATEQKTQVDTDLIPASTELADNVISVIYPTHYAVVLQKSETSTLTDEQFQELLAANGLEGMQ